MSDPDERFAKHIGQGCTCKNGEPLCKTSEDGFHQCVGQVIPRGTVDWLDAYARLKP